MKDKNILRIGAELNATTLHEADSLHVILKGFEFELVQLKDYLPVVNGTWPGSLAHIMDGLSEMSKIRRNRTSELPVYRVRGASFLCLPSFH